MTLNIIKASADPKLTFHLINTYKFINDIFRPYILTLMLSTVAHFCRSEKKMKRPKIRSIHRDVSFFTVHPSLPSRSFHFFSRTKNESSFSLVPCSMLPYLALPCFPSIFLSLFHSVSSCLSFESILIPFAFPLP